MEISLGKRLEWLTFLKNNIGLAKSLIGLLQELAAAETIDQYVEVIKGLLDLLKGVWANLPSDAEPVVAGDVMALVAAETDALELAIGPGQILLLLDGLAKLAEIIKAIRAARGK